MVRESRLVGGNTPVNDVAVPKKSESPVFVRKNKTNDSKLIYPFKNRLTASSTKKNHGASLVLQHGPASGPNVFPRYQVCGFLPVSGFFSLGPIAG